MDQSTASDAASRQKSCNACVKSKRRCDKLHPICSRCAERNEPCVYKRRRLDGPTPELLGEPSEVGESGPINSAAASVSFPFSGLSPFDVDFFDSGGGNDIDPFLDFVNAMGGGESEDTSMWITHGPQQTVGGIERAGTPIYEGIKEGYENMAGSGLCTPYAPWTLYDPTTRLHHLHKALTSFSSTFAATNATPFLHRHLYKDVTPPCIMSCFSTSVMYTNRTEANKAMVFRALAVEMDKLMGVAATTPYEKLARVHALLIYQMIRLFDGDVGLRVEGERDLAKLEEWVGELVRVGDNLGERDGGREVLVPGIWERWIFAESVRRTILMAYSAVALYNMMRWGSVVEGEDDNDLGPWGYIYRWTLSRHLWEAESSFAFNRLWEEKKPHFVIENYSLGEFLKYGRPQDVDEFGRIILTAYIGQDAVMEFLSGRYGATPVL